MTKVIYLGLFLALAIFPRSVLASNNLKVTCSQAGHNCEVSPINQPLFFENDIKPGYNFYSSISLSNNTLGDCHVYIKANKKIAVPANIDTMLLTKITKNKILLFDNPLSSLTGAKSPVYLDKVPASTTYKYEWKISMNPLAGNAFQASQLTFDLPITFRCDKIPCCNVPTPSIIPLPTIVPGWCHCEASGKCLSLNISQNELKKTGHIDSTGKTLHANDYPGDCLLPPKLGQGSLSLVPVCSTAPNLLNWQVYNATKQDVSFTWQILGTDEKGKGLAGANKSSLLQTPKTKFIQFLRINWADKYFSIGLNPGINCRK